MSFQVTAPAARSDPPAPLRFNVDVALRLVATGLLLGMSLVRFGPQGQEKTVFELLKGALPFIVPGVLALVTTTILAGALVLLWRKYMVIDARFHAPLLITYILAVGHANYGIFENLYSPFLDKVTNGWITTYSPTFVAIVTAILMELILSRLLAGKWPHLASAYISGISVGILIKSPYLYPYILCSVLTIASKYAIRVKGRHIWNPSNLGVTLMLWLAPQSVASLSVHMGNDIWPVIVIWILGCLILYKLGRLHIPLAFVAAFFVLACLRSWQLGSRLLTELSPMTSPMFQLFIFFMITDPKTTTKAKWSQILVAVLVAIAEHIFRMLEDVHSLYHSLFVVGPVTNLIEIWWTSRKEKLRTAVKPEETERMAALPEPVVPR